MQHFAFQPETGQKKFLIPMDCIKVPVVHAKFTFSSLLLRVTTLVNLKNENSQHTAFRGIQDLTLAGAIENLSHKSDFSGSDQEKKNKILLTGPKSCRNAFHMRSCL